MFDFKKIGESSKIKKLVDDGEDPMSLLVPDWPGPEMYAPVRTTCFGTEQITFY